MRVVLDTNVLVRMPGRRGPRRGLKQALLDGRLELAVSTQILLEYEEVVCRYAGREQWEMLARLLEVVDQLHGSIRQVSPTFRFLTVTGDPDDDAFVDCAIAGEAEFILTEDRHFDVLAGQGYRPQVIAPEELIRRFLF